MNDTTDRYILSDMRTRARWLLLGLVALLAGLLTSLLLASSAGAAPDASSAPLYVDLPDPGAPVPSEAGAPTAPPSAWEQVRQNGTLAPAVALLLLALAVAARQRWAWLREGRRTAVTAGGVGVIAAAADALAGGGAWPAVLAAALSAATLAIRPGPGPPAESAPIPVARVVPPR